MCINNYIVTLINNKSKTMISFTLTHAIIISLH